MFAISAGIHKMLHVRIQREGGGGGAGDQFLSNSGPDPLKNHNAKWRFAGGAMIACLKVVFGSFLLSSTKKKQSKLDPPPDKNVCIRACAHTGQRPS